ncbi:hypothetical protein [Streptomyces sp. NPDC057580]|uniref:hypothetical protein n=1 Tax=Streptomyces sp. NPDC057580 TaxID=3346173 RepID=UPI00369E3DCC
MSHAVHIHYTHLLRKSPLDLWVRLRNLLKEQSIDPANSVLVDLFPDGGDHEFGQIISEEGRVYRFDLMYDRDRPGGVRRATLRHWTDITDTWQTEPLQRQTADAVVSILPARRTELPQVEAEVVSLSAGPRRSPE